MIPRHPLEVEDDPPNVLPLLEPDPRNDWYLVGRLPLYFVFMDEFVVPDPETEVPVLVHPLLLPHPLFQPQELP